MTQAIEDVAASHSTRPVDEVLSVLRQAIRGASGSAETLPDDEVRRLAEQIANGDFPGDDGRVR